MAVFNELFGVSGGETAELPPVQAEIDQEGRRYVDLEAEEEVELYLAERR